jgi:gluconate 2-dehydrogenase alpha chain
MVSPVRAIQYPGSVYANWHNFMDLDPTYKDAFGRLLIRLTYNGTHDDHAMSRYLLTKSKPSSRS